MAVITQRKNEIESIAAIINTDTYVDATAMAKAVLKEAFEYLRNRPLYLVAVRIAPSAPALLFGVESSEAAAVKFAESLGTGGTASVFTINPMGAVEARLLEQETLEWEATIMPCANCGHHQWEHERFITGRGKPLAKQPAKHKCHILCKCKGYVRPEQETS